MQMYHYRFTNKSMEADVVDPKTDKVLVHKEINSIAYTEEEARKKTALPKMTPSDILPPEWELTGTYTLSKDWV